MERSPIRKKIKRPPFEGLYPYLLFLLLGFFVADLVLIPLRGRMLPTQAPPSKPPVFHQNDMTSKGAFSGILNRNVFSPDGKIPDSLAQKAKGEPSNQPDAAPVPSNLPLNLIGTIVHSNPAKSIANVELRSKSTVIAVRVEKSIDNLATLVAVERGKIIIRNSNNQRLEYLELKNTSKLSFNASKPVGSGPQEVKQVGQNKFEISRADVTKYTSDMAAVLQQAAMQPRRNASGEIEGFKFLSIQPNTIYTQLGFQVGDVIKSVNGVPITSPAQAMEMYNNFKNSPNIKITVERDGRDQDFDYNVTK